jgi:carbamoyl-phosphate synthase large subunit
VATDRSPLSSAGFLADEFRLVPSVTDPTFVDALAALVDRYEVDVIVPTIDTELAVLAAARDRLAVVGADVLISDPDTIELCADKRSSSRWLAENGFPVPRQYPPDELERLAGLGQLAWPLFFKPLAGSSSIGAQPVESLDEVRLATGRHGPGVVEQLVVGEEFTMDCWVDPEGRCRAVVPRRRLAVRAGEIAKGITVRHPELEEVTAAIVEALPGARGPITVQAIVSGEGPAFIEINPRFGGGYPLSHAAGARYTAALAATAAGSPVEDAWFLWSDDTVMLRYDAAVFVPRSAVDGVTP